MKAPENLRPSILLMATVMCAALYAVGSFVTAYIPSPWGMGQFRPAVVIPSFFAVIFGPLPAGIGAAIGTLINDSVKYGRIYEGSLIAAVPGNFIGFFLFGYIVKKKFTWGRFILASNLTLTIANFITAALYVFAFKVLYAHALKLPMEALTFLVIGLTIWWFVTMLPFVLLATPPLIRVAASSFPSIVPKEVRTHSLAQELPRTTLGLAMIIPGLFMLLMGFATTYTSLGVLMTANLATPAVIQTLIQVMFYLSGTVLSVLGILIFKGKQFFSQKSLQKKLEGKS